MDVYSFGVLMWEIWHEKLPFDEDLGEAVQVVLKEEKRPYIAEINADGTNDDENSESELGCVTASMAELIRMCWQEDTRPAFADICAVLTIE